MIKTSTISFLNNLQLNNNREWFQRNKKDYDLAKEDVLQFTAELILQLSKTAILIPASLQPKDCVMRIYRDIRFSKNKTPYKTNFGIAISENGKNFIGPGYYLHIEPENSFLAGGSWMPESAYLKSIRQEIDYNSEDFNAIIGHQSFRSGFGELMLNDKLKTAPKGYPKDHPDIELLKLKSFTASRKLTNSELTNPSAVKNIVAYFLKLHPLIVFLRNAIP